MGDLFDGSADGLLSVFGVDVEVAEFAFVVAGVGDGVIDAADEEGGDDGLKGKWARFS